MSLEAGWRLCSAERGLKFRPCLLCLLLHDCVSSLADATMRQVLLRAFQNRAARLERPCARKVMPEKQILKTAFFIHHERCDRFVSFFGNAVLSYGTERARTNTFDNFCQVLSCLSNNWSIFATVNMRLIVLNVSSMCASRDSAVKGIVCLLEAFSSFASQPLLKSERCLIVD